MSKRVKRISTYSLPDNAEKIMKYGHYEMRLQFTEWIEDFCDNLNNDEIPYDIRLIAYELLLAHYDYMLGSIFQVLWWCSPESVETYKKQIKDFYKRTCNFTTITTNVIFAELLKKEKQTISISSVGEIVGENRIPKRSTNRRLSTKSFIKNMVVGKMSLENESSAGIEETLKELFPDKTIEYEEIERIRNRSREKYRGFLDDADYELTKLIQKNPFLFIRVKSELFKILSKVETKKQVQDINIEDYFLEEIFPLELNYLEAEQRFHLTFSKMITD